MTLNFNNEFISNENCLQQFTSLDSIDEMDLQISVSDF